MKGPPLSPQKAIESIGLQHIKRIKLLKHHGHNVRVWIGSDR